MLVSEHDDPAKYGNKNRLNKILTNEDPKMPPFGLFFSSRLLILFCHILQAFLEI